MSKKKQNVGTMCDIELREWHRSPFSVTGVDLMIEHETTDGTSFTSWWDAQAAQKAISESETLVVRTYICKDGKSFVNVGGDGGLCQALKDAKNHTYHLVCEKTLEDFGKDRYNRGNTLTVTHECSDGKRFTSYDAAVAHRDISDDKLGLIITRYNVTCADGGVFSDSEFCTARERTEKFNRNKKVREAAETLSHVLALDTDYNRDQFVKAFIDNQDLILEQVAKAFDMSGNLYG